MTAKENQMFHKQYFTPGRIANFMINFAMALEPGLLSENDRVMDPSAGEGIFLSEASRMNIVKKENLFAIEKDISLNDHWDMNGYYGIPRKNVIFADTLKLVVSESFKLVIGNPPFGLIRTDDADKLKTDRYTIYNDYIATRKNRKISSFPMEVLFLEKFLGLCQPGGMIAIVLPYGIFSNSGMEYVRRWLAERCSIKAIIELGGRLFQSIGASARTTLLFAVKKQKDQESAIQSKVILGYAENIAQEMDVQDDLQSLIEMVNHTSDLEASGYSADRTLTVQEKDWADLGVSRWDPSYYDPAYENLYRDLLSHGNPVKLRDLLIPHGIITGYKGVQKYASTDDRILYITSKQITDEGIDLTKDNLFIDRDSLSNPERSRIKEGDILLVRSGDGCIGRAILATPEIYGANIRSEIYILRVDPAKAKPSAVLKFLKSRLVPYNKRMIHFQIRRLLSGVGTPNLNKEEIGSMLILTE